MQIWRSYLHTLGETPEDTQKTFTSWYFSDKEADPNECSQPVLRGVQPSTSPTLSWLPNKPIPVPRPGDLSVVTDGDGVAHCIICTTHVDIVPLAEVSTSHTAAEGGGDGSLDDWRRTHRLFYQRESENRPYERFTTTCSSSPNRSNACFPRMILSSRSCKPLPALLHFSSSFLH